MRGSSWADDGNTNVASTSNSTPPFPSSSRRSSSNYKNVYGFLARREVCPRAKHVYKNLRRESDPNFVSDAWRALISWVEAESLQHLSAKYCPLAPAPRSTIAAAFSTDGRTLASTHGDHTVKIIDCQTGKCLKVLSGHRRTPWVVRFHPLCPDILASGSLDHEVRLWNAKTAECIGSCDFYRPIASIAFHAGGEILAVASGHKLYLWQYNKRGEASPPPHVLRTRRSLRAVHFHPHGAPFLLTAEVNDLDSSESSMSLATSAGHLSYPAPTLYFPDAHFSGHLSVGGELPFSLQFLMSLASGGRIPVQQIDRDVASSQEQQRLDHPTSVRLLTYSTPSGQYELLLSPVEPDSAPPVSEETQIDSFVQNTDNEALQFSMDAALTSEVQSSAGNIPSIDQVQVEPFLHGCLVGQSQAGRHSMASLNGLAHDNLTSIGERDNHTSLIQSRGNGRSGPRHRSSRSQTVTTTGSAGTTAFVHDVNNAMPSAGRLESELAASLAAAAAAELPCTVKLRIWPFDVKDPFNSLDAERCRLTIPHAVLCSEMGAHFSPCGKYLAACVACLLPHLEADPGLHGQALNDNTGDATSPTRHPISAHQVMYELRIYSLEEATFGLVLSSRAIRAAHCLTSIQFSPTSEHILLAYGRRHGSLLKSVVLDRETTVPIYTILEVYQVSDMKLVSVLPSVEDEVNVACFHPSVGGGLVYGTKEGKLRILQYDRSHSTNYTSSCLLYEHEVEAMTNVPTYALEC